jgi:hypothetical protein
MRPSLAGIILAVVTLPAGQPATAQVPSRPATVLGRVLDAATRQPLRYVVVDIVDQERRVETDEAGLFRIEGLSPQLVTVRLRSIGYAVTERSLNLFAGREAAVEYLLSRPPPRLADLRVVAQPARLPANTLMEGFEDRQRLGIGKFYGEDELKRHPQRRVPDLLRDAPGVRFVQGSSGEYLLASTRQPMGVGGGRSDGACFLQVVVDGMVVWSPAPSVPGRVTFGPPDLAHLVPLSDLVGVEVYSGISGMPALFRNEGNNCGAVLFWTRRGEYVPVLR